MKIFSIWRSSYISKSLLIKTLLLSGFLTAIITAFQMMNLYQEGIDTANKKFKDIENTRISSLSALIWDFNNVVIEKFLQNLIKLPGIDYVEVNTSLKNYNFTEGYKRKSQYITHAFKLAYGETPIGELIVYYNKNIIYWDIQRKLISTVLFLVIKSIIFSFIFLYLVQQTIIKHIDNIILWLGNFNALKPFAKLDLGSNISPKNELNKLANYFNKFGRNIHDQAIKLEKEVEQRTIELQRKTQELENTQVELQKLLFKKEQKLKNLENFSNDWIWELDQFGNIVTIPSEMLSLFVSDNTYPIPTKITDILIQSEADTSISFKSKFLSAIKNKQPISFPEICFKTIKKDDVWLQITVTPYFSEDGLFHGYHGITKNITEQKKLEKLAFTDGLTNVSNRVTFINKAEDEIERARRLNYHLGIMMLDLDDFKSINDTYGHDAGDTVLKSVAMELTNCLRNQDLVGRIGGEEFAILVVGADATAMLQLAKRINVAISSLEFDFLVSRKVTISIGYTIINQDEALKVALKRADSYLYQAKYNGKNQFVTDHKCIQRINRPNLN